jgi:hypothetical protein
LVSRISRETIFFASTSQNRNEESSKQDFAEIFLKHEIVDGWRGRAFFRFDVRSV